MRQWKGTCGEVGGGEKVRVFLFIAVGKPRILLIVTLQIREKDKLVLRRFWNQLKMLVRLRRARIEATIEEYHVRIVQLRYHLTGSFEIR
jgi:hypothetical protein